MASFIIAFIEFSGLGFVTGPAVGSLLVQLKLDFEMISFVSAGMSGFNLLFALIFFRESLKKDALSSKVSCSFIGIMH